MSSNKHLYTIQKVHIYIIDLQPTLSLAYSHAHTDRYKHAHSNICHSARITIRLIRKKMPMGNIHRAASDVFLLTTAGTRS